MAIDSITVVGPTASGKTHRAVCIARHFGGEIISADSRQVYRDMSLGTGKDLDEYGEVKYHLIDICEAGEKYNLYRYLTDFNECYNSILSQGKMPIICGGSGMYVENAINGIRMPEVPCNPSLRRDLEDKSIEELTDILKSFKVLHNSTDIDSRKRVIRAIEVEKYYSNNPEQAKNSRKGEVSPLNSLIIGIDIPREVRRESISRRLNERLENGMLDEVRNLLGRGIPAEDLIYYGLEYKYLTLHLTGAMSYRQMVSELEIAIHQFAKRQMTWFRGMEKRGSKIFWMPYNLDDRSFIQQVEELFNVSNC